jgi:hypothetical protein
MNLITDGISGELLRSNDKFKIHGQGGFCKLSYNCIFSRKRRVKGQCPETKNKLEIMRRLDLKDNGSHIYISTEND